ncbi:MAG: TIGR04325 family methyltransferase [Rhodanobacteraceae bacterium]
MHIETLIGGVARRVARLPGARHALAAIYERRFARETPRGNLYRGVFDNFAQAQASAPSSRPLGYDHAAAAAMYRERTRQVFISDYPLLFWLRELIGTGCRSIYDLGGHIGIGYYAYQRYLNYPADLRWLVHDVPAVMEAGRLWASEHDTARRLGFSAQRDAGGDMDILLASGSLQYLDYTLAELLDALAHPPEHILLNLTPLHVTDSFFTLQNMGTAYCPYRVSSERDLLHGLRERGYTRVDRWENPDRRCHIPFHPAQSLDRYFGFYFRRAR